MLKVYNTMTRRKEEFRPLKEGEVSIYCCGVTSRRKSPTRITTPLTKILALPWM